MPSPKPRNLQYSADVIAFSWMTVAKRKVYRPPRFPYHWGSRLISMLMGHPSTRSFGCSQDWPVSSCVADVPQTMTRKGTVASLSAETEQPARIVAICTVLTLSQSRCIS